MRPHSKLLADCHTLPYLAPMSSGRNTGDERGDRQMRIGDRAWKVGDCMLWHCRTVCVVAVEDDDYGGARPVGVAPAPHYTAGEWWWPHINDEVVWLNEPIAQPEAAAVPPFVSDDSAVRKGMPVASGVLAYFPDALLCVALVSRAGNDKHNPGEPLHWAREKSQDEPDCVIRHMLDYYRQLPPDPGLESLGPVGHLASAAWRALANLQRACDAVRAERAQ